MSKLSLIVKKEYLTDVRTRSFWITTLLMPVVMVAFGIFLSKVSATGQTGFDYSVYSFEPTPHTMAVIGMLTGMVLTLFIMLYGAQIFNKVKAEKSNRIVEIIATCVDGRTMMLAKIVAVGFVGLTQLFLWFILTVILSGGLAAVLSPVFSWSFLFSPVLWKGIAWCVAFFTGGYIFYGSFYAAIGAMTDRNGENQEYMTVLTFILLGAFYIGQYSSGNAGGLFQTICLFLPFTSPTLGTIFAVGDVTPLWENILSVVTLYIFAWIAVILAGKIYTSSLLLKGKRFSLRDIITFLRSK